MLSTCSSCEPWGREFEAFQVLKGPNEVPGSPMGPNMLSRGGSSGLQEATEARLRLRHELGDEKTIYPKLREVGKYGKLTRATGANTSVETPPVALPTCNFLIKGSKPGPCVCRTG